MVVNKTLDMLLERRGREVKPLIWCPYQYQPYGRWHLSIEMAHQLGLVMVFGAN